jgi:hypothetical protein
MATAYFIRNQHHQGQRPPAAAQEEHAAVGMGDDGAGAGQAPRQRRAAGHARQPEQGRHAFQAEGAADADQRQRRHDQGQNRHRAQGHFAIAAGLHAPVDQEGQDGPDVQGGVGDDLLEHGGPLSVVSEGVTTIAAR